MILRIRHKGLRELFETGQSRRLPPDQIRRLGDILTMLEYATGPHEQSLLRLDLHQLAGDLRGFWAVRVTGNYRVIFRFEGEHVDDVDLLDYH